MVRRSTFALAFLFVIAGCSQAQRSPTPLPPTATPAPVAATDCRVDPWPEVGLDGLTGMTATSLDSARIELHNGTDRRYSYRVNVWPCGDRSGEEVERGPIEAGETYEIRVNVPFEVPVTIAFWDQLCGEACTAGPFAAMLVTRSPERPMATD